jgi:uncharacterized HhH-GPD family protein
MAGDLYITGDAAADELLNTDGTALLIGMLLDQQVPMEWAFTGPATLRQRLGHLDATKIAAMGEDEFVEVCAQKPAVHRFPASMGRRVHALCTVLADQYDGRAERLWADAADGKELARRLKALPGFGDEKTKIFVALLAKRQDVRLPGWEQAAGLFADETPRSVADVHDDTSLTKVREWKRAQKAAKKDKQDRAVRG